MTQTATYTVTGLSCGKCVARVTDALMPLADHVAVTLSPPQAVLTAPKADMQTLQAALETAHPDKYQLSPATVAPQDAPNGFFATYRPVLLIVGYIAMASFAGNADWHAWMINFMAGFFLVFSFFKLLDPRGFANSYRMYDLLAARVPVYGRVYPYLELALGLAFLFRIALPVTLWLTLLLMAFGSIGVIRALIDKKQIRCACLGTALNLPLSSVALIEDLGMAAMAAVMLAAY